MHSKELPALTIAAAATSMAMDRTIAPAVAIEKVLRIEARSAAEVAAVTKTPPLAEAGDARALEIEFR